MFLQEQRRDQEAAEHEEDVDAEKSTGSNAAAGVVQHDGDDGECAQALECGQVYPPALRRCILSSHGSRRTLSCLSYGYTEMVRRRSRGWRTSADVPGSCNPGVNGSSPGVHICEATPGG